MEGLPCFGLAPVLSKHSSGVTPQIVRQRFVSGGLCGGIGLRRTKQTLILKASASQNNQSEEYKKFAELLGAPDGKFSEKEQVKDIPVPVQEDAAEVAAKRASDYEKMSDVLGSPKGRFQRKFDDASRQENKRGLSVESKDKTSEFLNETNTMQSEDDRTFSELVGAPEGNFSEKKQVKGKEDEMEAATKRVEEYEKMAEILGPPKGRFQNKDENARAKKAKPPRQVKSKPENVQSLDDTRATEPEEQKLQELKKEAKTKEEEYKLFESILRGGKGTKPRKGGKRFFTRELLIEGFVTDPWNTDFNLMPKKTAGNAKGSPPKKGQAPLKMPNKVFLTSESIEQSYWALEQVLEDEEFDYQAAKAREKQAADEKREQKRKAKLLRKPAHPNDVISHDVKPNPKGEDAQSGESEAMASTAEQVEQKPISVLQEPPRRPLETDSSDSTRPSRNAEKSLVAPSTDEKPKSILDNPPQRPGYDSNGESPVELENKSHTRKSRENILLLESPKLLYNLDEGRIEQ